MVEFKSVLGKAKELSLKTKITIGFVFILGIIFLSQQCNGQGSSGTKNTLNYLRSVNTEAARDWADFIEAYGIDAFTSSNIRILDKAVGDNNIDLVKAIIKDKSVLDLRCDAYGSQRPLSRAVGSNKLEITKLLLESGAKTYVYYGEGHRNIPVDDDVLSAAFFCEGEMFDYILNYCKKNKKLDCSSHDCSVFDNVFGYLNGYQLIQLFNAGFVPSPRDLSIIIERDISFPDEISEEGNELIKSVLQTYKDYDIYAEVYENKSAWVKEKLAR